MQEMPSTNTATHPSSSTMPFASRFIRQRDQNTQAPRRQHPYSPAPTELFEDALLPGFSVSQLNDIYLNMLVERSIRERIISEQGSFQNTVTDTFVDMDKE
ncbi:MAG: hypothetical protein ACRCV3_03215 [Desulfovibrionaceae bacterium]